MSFEKFSEFPKFFYIGEYFVADLKQGPILFRVKDVDMLNYIRTGSLNPGQAYTDTSNQNKILEPPSGYLYSFMIGVRGPVKVFLNQPPAVSKWGVSSYPGFITEESSPLEDPDPRTTVYTLNGYPIAYTIENPLNLTTSYIVKFQGFKYSIESVAQISSDGTFSKLTNTVPDRVISLFVNKYYEGSLPILSLIGITTNR